MKNRSIAVVFISLLFPFLVHAEPPPPQEGDDKPNPSMRKFWKFADQDGDGVISTVEFAKLPRVQRLPNAKQQALFSRLDRDMDGKLNRSELRGFGKRPPMKRLWRLDTNQSGGISFGEFILGEFAKKLPVERQRKVFNRLDTNGDGVISRKDRPQPRR